MRWPQEGDPLYQQSKPVYVMVIEIDEERERLALPVFLMQKEKHEEFQKLIWKQREEWSSSKIQEPLQPNANNKCHWHSKTFDWYRYRTYHTNCFWLEKLLSWHGGEVGDVHEDVHDDDYGHADQDGAGKILHRILSKQNMYTIENRKEDSYFYLFSNKIKLVPAIVVPEAIESDQSNTCWSQRIQELESIKAGLEAVHMTLAETDKSPDNNDDNSNHFRHRYHVLRVGQDWLSMKTV